MSSSDLLTAARDLRGLGEACRALDEIVAIANAGRMRMGSAPLREQQIFQRQLGTHMMAVKAARLLARESYGAAVETIDRGGSHLVFDERNYVEIAKQRLGRETLPI